MTVIPALWRWSQEEQRFKVILGYVMSLRVFYMRPYLKRKEGRKKKRKEKSWADVRRKVRAFLSNSQPPTCLLLIEAEAISVCLRVFWGHLGLGFPAAGEVPEFPEPSQDWHLAQHPLGSTIPVPLDSFPLCPWPSPCSGDLAKTRLRASGSHGQIPASGGCGDTASTAGTGPCSHTGAAALNLGTSPPGLQSTFTLA